LYRLSNDNEIIFRASWKIAYLETRRAMSLCIGTVCQSIAHRVLCKKHISKLSKKHPFYQNCHCFDFSGKTLCAVFQKPFFFSPCWYSWLIKNLTQALEGCEWRGTILGQKETNCKRQKG